MKQEYLKLTKHTVIYGAGMMISKVISFIMLPIYTRYLTPADYGTVELLTSTIDVISMIVGLGLTGTIFKYYYEYEDQTDRNEVISTAAIMMIGIALFTAVCGVLLSSRLSLLVFHHEQNDGYFRIIFTIYFLQQGTLIIPFMFMRAVENSKLFVLINLIKLFVQVAFNILFVVVFKMGIQGVLISTLLADSLIGLYLIAHTFRKVGFRFSFSKSMKMVKFGYPFIFVSLSSFVLTYSDRYFLNTFSDLKTVGIYALAYKFGFLMAYIAVAPFMQTWEPQRFEIAKQDNALQIFNKVFLYFNIVVISLSLAIVLLVKDALAVMSGPAYHEAYKLVPIIITAYVFQAWTFFCNLGIYIQEHSNYMAIASLISAVVVTILNYILIPKYGAYGAAWATAGAFFIRFFLIYVLAQKLYWIDYGWHKQLLLFLASIVIYLASTVITSSRLIPSLGINLFLFAFFEVMIYSFFLENPEKKIIADFIKKPQSILRVFQGIRMRV